MKIDFKDLTTTSFYTEKEEEYLIKIIDDSSSNDREARKRLYVSSAGFCPRKNVLDMQRPDRVEKLGVSGMFYTKVGLCYEEIVELGLCEQGKLIIPQYKLENELFDGLGFTMGGVLDFIYFDHLNQLSIGECKTTKQVLNQIRVLLSKKQFKEGILVKQGEFDKTTKEVGVKPLLEHVSQIMLYSAITGIDNSNLFYISRKIIEKYNQPLAIKFFNVNTNYTNLLYFTTMACYSHLAWQANIVPNRLESFKKSMCTYCPYKEDCWLSDNTNFNDELYLEAIELATNYLSKREERKEWLLDNTLELPKQKEFNPFEGNFN